MILVRLFRVFLVMIVSLVLVSSFPFPESFGEGITLDKSVYPIPTEGHPLTIYVTAPSEVTISVWAGEPWIKVLGTTSSGVFTIYYDDYNFDSGFGVMAEYFDDIKKKEYTTAAGFNNRGSVLQIDQPLYVVNYSVEQIISN